MNNFKKFVAVLLGVVMACVFATSAFADTASDKAAIIAKLNAYGLTGYEDVVNSLDADGVATLVANKDTPVSYTHLAVGCTLGALAAPDAVSVVPLAVSAGVGVTAALALPGSVMRRIFPPPAPPVQAQGLSGAARKLSAVADTLSDIADTVNAVCQRQMPPKGESRCV